MTQSNDSKNNRRYFFSVKYSMLILCTLVFFLFSGCKNEKDPEVLLRAALIVNEGHPWHEAFVFLSKTLEKESDGRIRLEVYHSEQLAKEIEAIRLIQAGVIDMTVTGSTLSNWVETAAFCEIPYLLTNSDDMRKLLNHPMGKMIEDEILESTGLRVVCYFERGARHLTANRPIRHPDDLNGLILRVPNVPAYITAWQAMGAKPTPMAFSEVFTALQQNTIDAQENPMAMIKAAGFAEVQSHLNLTGHVVSWVYPVLGEKQFQAMPEDLKAIFVASVDKMQKYEQQLTLENELTIRKELEAKGMTMVEVDKEAFAERCEQAIYESFSPRMKKLYKEILEITRNK